MEREEWPSKGGVWDSFCTIIWEKNTGLLNGMAVLLKWDKVVLCLVYYSMDTQAV